MFSEQVRELLDALGATNTDIARYAGCNPSSISRLRTGARTPKPSSPTVQKLILGVYLFANDLNILALLRSILHITPTASTDEIETALRNWLYEIPQTEPIKPIGNTTIPTVRYRIFGEKLNAVMNMLTLSNVRLGKAINLDPSHISRFRNGVRNPKSNKNIIDQMCHILFTRTIEQKKIKELLDLMGIPDQFSSKTDHLELLFSNWLYDFNLGFESHAINCLFERIDTLSLDETIVLPSFSLVATKEILDNDVSNYYGTDGLRTAVIRFFGNAAILKVKELYLYSDQDLSWIMEDKEFLLKWLVLMRECIHNGTRIIIIHNIGRNIDEMIAAIDNWLPLYMSGMIKPYWCKKKLDGRFTHTLFLCPEVGCINACHVKGYETDGLYFYYTDVTHLTLFKNQYDGLLAMSEPLVT